MESESRRVSSHGNRLLCSVYVLPFCIVVNFDTTQLDYTIPVDHQKLDPKLNPFFIFLSKNLKYHLSNLRIWEIMYSYLHNQLTLTNHLIYINTQVISHNNSDSLISYNKQSINAYTDTYIYIYIYYIESVASHIFRPPIVAIIRQVWFEDHSRWPKVVGSYSDRNNSTNFYVNLLLISLTKLRPIILSLSYSHVTNYDMYCQY